MRHHGRLGIYFLLCSLISSSGRSNEFIPLGFLPSASGTVASNAYGVDASGQAVVGEAASNGQSVAFVWQKSSGMQPLDRTNGAYIGNAISEDGATVVGRARTQQALNGESFLWSKSQGFNIIGSIVQTPNGSGAEDVSGDGTVVVGWSPTRSSTFEAYRWTAQAGFEPLGDLNGGSYESVAQAVSSDGRVIVGQSDSENGTEAFRWTQATGMVGMGDLPGGDFHSIALDASVDGQVIVGSGASPAAFEEAFRWDAVSGMVGLGFLPNGYPRSSALAVTKDGAVVAGYSGLTQADLRAFVWDQTHGMRSLQELLTSDSALAGDLSGWQLAMAYDISADGRDIVGWGYNPDGNPEAWLVRLDQPLLLHIPEPTFAVTLLAFTITFGLKARLRHFLKAKPF